MNPKATRVPWLGALAMACALCAGYPFMRFLRGVWQDHYPQLAAQWSNDGRFTVLGWYGTELAYEELGYADKVNDQAHHFLAFDPYIRSSRSWRQFAIDRLSYATLGALDAAVGDISAAWIIARFLCCAAWFLLIYFLALRASDYPPIAFCCAAFVTGYSYILTFLFTYGFIGHGGLAHIFAHDLWAVISYGRTESVLRLIRPGFNYAVSFLAAVCLIKAAENKKIFWAVLSGILGGALAYVHLDVWSTYILTTFLLALVISARDKKPAWNLWGSSILAALLSLPFLFLNYPPDPDLLLKTGILPGRYFDPLTLVYLGVFFLGLRKRKNMAVIFCACLSAAIFVMVNTDLIVGYSLAPHNWMYYGNIFILILALSFIPERFKSGAKYWRGAAWAIMFAALLQGLSYAAIHYPFQGLPKDYDSALAWLNHNTPKDSEVLTINPEIGALIPAYTRDKTTSAFNMAVFTDYPLLKNCERFVASLKILGANPQKFFSDCIFRAPRYSRRQIIATGMPRGQIEKSDVETYLFDLTPFNRIPSILSQAEKNPASIHPDYIWFGVLEKQYARPNFSRAEKTRWREVYRNPSVIIYARSGKPRGA